MKKQSTIMLIVVALVALLFSAGPVAAEETKTEFSGLRNFIRIVDAGFSHVSNDGVIHVRDRVVEFEIVTDDPSVTGTQTIIPNSDLGPFDGGVARSGPTYGTFSIVLNGEKKPSWEGTFAGYGYTDGYWYHIYVGHGKRQFEGLRFYAFSEVIEPGPNPPSRTWSVYGYILSPEDDDNKKVLGGWGSNHDD
jgi:hypothetical protein